MPSYQLSTETGQLHLLVGGNPLPNYVAALTLGQKLGIDKAHLLYTKEVEDAKNNLRGCLTAAGFTCREDFIRNAGDPIVIRSACQAICAESHLHYTGGTSAMAVHVHAAWTLKGGKPGQASYLFGLDDRLMTDAGCAIDIPANIQLDLATLTALHGPKAALPSAMVGPDLPADAEEIANCVYADPDLARRIYTQVPPRDRQFKAAPFCPSKEGLALSEARIPGLSWPSDQIKGWRKFLRGEWLDRWVYQKIMDTGLVDANYLHADVKGRIRGRDFQLDVVAVRGHHLYVVSCTTSQSLDRCKSKLFEVSMRARQLGGDLARSALVCLIHQDDQRTDLVDELRNDVLSLSESTRVSEVFGLEQIREWAGHGSARPNLSSLESWLKS